MRAKNKVVNGFDVLTQAMRLGAELVGTIRKQLKDAGKTAECVAGDLRDEAATQAERLGNSLRDRLRTRPSVTARALPFAAGLGLGVGAGMLFAPASGKQTREKLRKAAGGQAAVATGAAFEQ